MKLFAKINRGLILTAVIFIAVVIYLVTLSISHNLAKPEIEKVCRDYIKTEISYRTLPEIYRKAKPDMPQAELDTLIAKMENDIKAFYPKSQQIYKFKIEEIKTSLENQFKGINVVYDYTKEISKFKDFAFKDNNTVTVTITTNSSLDGPSPYSGTGAREKVAAQTEDIIMLQKVDGKWIVNYANLNQPMNQQNVKEGYTVTKMG